MLPRARPERLRLERGTRDEGAYPGRFQVAGVEGGTSEVTVRLSFFDDRRAPGRDAVAAALDSSLRRVAPGGPPRPRAGPPAPVSSPAPRRSSRRRAGTGC
ncbi:hypothetical protein AB0G32_39045 [Streptomyces sp. NPDC023723]|uniref:hypothetical protein n=1 Tax=Streptomyces sp. NPDC023723 TaxID=3154323 RepID=UPI003409A708